MIKVAVLGEDTLAGCDLSAAVDLQVIILSATSLNQAIDDIIGLDADVVVLDQDNEDLHADVVCSFLAKQHSRAQTLIMTRQIPHFDMLAQTGFSARGYIMPEQRPVLAKAIHAVHDGEAWLPRRLVAEMLDHFAAGPN
ncbi:MAG: hypothetical protein WEB02_06260 [Methylophaga sp.]